MVDQHEEPKDQYRNAYEALQEIEQQLDEINQHTDSMDIAISNTADDVHEIRRELSIDDFEQEVYL